MNLLIITRKVSDTDVRMQFFYDWIVAFSRQVGQLYVICLEQGSGVEKLPKNVTVVSMGKEHGYSRLRKLARYISALCRFIPKTGGVFVHMMPIYALFAGPIAKFFGKRIYLWYTHRVYDRSWNSMLLWMTQWVVTGYLSASLESFPLPTTKPVIAFGHAIDLKKFPYIESSADTGGVLFLMSTGRITRRKNLHILIDAVRILRDQFSLPVRCEIIGVPALSLDEEYLHELRALVTQFGLENEVYFLGAVEHHLLVHEYIHTEIFVNISDTHSLDKAILEPMACGVITITSNEAMQKIFGDLAPQLMVSPEAFAIAKKCKELWQLPHTTKEGIRRQLRHIVETEHNMDITIPKIVNFYRI